MQAIIEIKNGYKQAALMHVSSTGGNPLLCTPQLQEKKHRFKGKLIIMLEMTQQISHRELQMSYCRSFNLQNYMVKDDASKKR